MNKAFKAAVAELSFNEKREAFSYLKNVISEERVSVREKRAELKLQLAATTETRGKRSTESAEEAPKKKKKRKKNREE